MKNFAKLVALAATLVAVAFTSCNNGANTDATVSSEMYEAKRKSIQLVASSEDGIINFGSDSARTIMPTTKTGSALKYYLLYKNLTANAAWKLSEELTFEEDKKLSADHYSTGTITRVFDLADYSFILYAVDTTDPAYIAKINGSSLDENNIGTFAQYAAYANADLRYHDTIRFQLKVNNTASGEGTVNLTIKHENDWAVPENYEVYAQICKIDGADTGVYPASLPTDGNIIKRSDSTRTLGTGVAFGASTAIATGEYNLIVSYKKYKADGTYIATYYYTEKIIILLNQETSGDVVIPEILEKAPAAPTNLVVGYSIPDNTDSNYYKVRFAWKDNADNESEYRLELKQVDGDNTYWPVQPQSDSTWSLTSTGALDFTKLSYQASDLNPGLNDDSTGNGSLNKNSQFVTVLLPLEHRYIARICAVNAAGNSAYLYPSMDTTADAYKLKTSDGTVTLSSTDWTEFGTNVTTINLFKINYDLNGGKFVNADDTGTALTTPATLVHYAKQTTNTGSVTTDSKGTAGTGTVILNPDAITTNAYFTDIKGINKIGTAIPIAINNNGQYWSKWVTNFETNSSPYSVDYPQTWTWIKNGGSYIANIKYFRQDYDNNTEKRELGSQPNAGNWNGGKYDGTSKDYFVRKVTVSNYTEYKNLTLVAKYDTSKVLYIETDNLSEFEITGDMIAPTFSKGGTALSGASAWINSAEDVAADTITGLDVINDGTTFFNVLPVSQAKVDSLKFVLTGKFTTTKYDETNNEIVKTTNVNYDTAHLVVTRVRDNVILVDSDWTASSKSWEFPIQSWTPGKYTVQFTSHISEQPTTTYSYTCALNVTQ